MNGARGWASAVRGWVGVAGLLAATGCGTLPGMKGVDGPDPLTGDLTVKRTLPPATATAATTPATLSPPNPTPPVPAPSSATSLAALTTGGAAPLPNDRELRISPPAKTKTDGDTQLWVEQNKNATPIASAQGQGAPASGSGQPTVKLSGPAESGAAPTMLTGATGGSGVRPAAVTSGGETIEQLQEALKARGVKVQSFETQDGATWRFRGYRPNPDKPGFESCYDVPAPTLIAAMQAVIDQIDKESSNSARKQ